MKYLIHSALRLDHWQCCLHCSRWKMDEVLHLRTNVAKNAHHIKKKFKNKCYSELNFVQKNARADMSLPPTSGTRGFERYPSLKYYNVEKWKSRFTLRLDATENTHRIRN